MCAPAASWRTGTSRMPCSSSAARNGSISGEGRPKTKRTPSAARQRASTWPPVNSAMPTPCIRRATSLAPAARSLFDRSSHARDATPCGVLTMTAVCTPSCAGLGRPTSAYWLITKLAVGAFFESQLAPDPAVRRAAASYLLHDFARDFPEVRSEPALPSSAYCDCHSQVCDALHGQLRPPGRHDWRETCSDLGIRQRLGRRTTASGRERASTVWWRGGHHGRQESEQYLTTDDVSRGEESLCPGGEGRARDRQIDRRHPAGA